MCPRNRILLGIYLAVCYRIVKLKEFKLTYSESSESCAIAELTNLLEPIVYKYNNPTVKFTAKWSRESVTFLDTRIIREGNYLITDLYTKPTDTH